MLFCFLPLILSKFPNLQKPITARLHVEIGGFNNGTTLISNLMDSLGIFYSKKQYKNFEVNVEYDFKEMPNVIVNQCLENIANSKNTKPTAHKEIKNFIFDRSSDLIETISQYVNGHKKDDDIHLVLLNSGPETIYVMQYGDAPQSSDCFLFNSKIAFCHFNLPEEGYRTALFRRIAEFVDTLLLPPPPENDLPIPSKYVIPVISFGDFPLKIHQLEDPLHKLLPRSITNVISITEKNIYDFPLIAAGMFKPPQCNNIDLLPLIQNSSHVLGTSFANAFSDNLNMKILPTFLFRNDESYAEVDGVTSAIFSYEDDVTRLALSAIAENIPGLRTNFSGHHPMYPNGGAEEFSAIFEDSVARSFIFGDLQHAIAVYDEINETIKWIDGQNLKWTSTSKYTDQLTKIYNLINKTATRVSNGQFEKAMSSCNSARVEADNFKADVDKLKKKVEIFGRCCPVIKVVKKPIAKLHWIAAVVAVLISIWAVLKFISLYKVRRNGYIPAVFDY